MSKKVWVSICLVMVLALFATAVHAQQGTPTPRPTPTNVPPDGGGSPPPETEGDTTRGSIRGTVFNDANADGSCAGETPLAGVPIKFVSNKGDTTVYLQSGDNGTYGLVAAGLGTWTVTAEPGAGSIVTSQNPLQVFIGEEERLALGVDFCVAKGSGTGTGGTGGPGHGPGTVILPTAGAAVAPSLVIAGLSGASLILAGAGIEWQRRRKSRNVKPASKETTDETTQ